MRLCRLSIAALAVAAAPTLAAAQASPAADAGRHVGFAVGYAEYYTSYYGSDGTISYGPWIAWSQLQASAFLERRGPALGARPGTLRLEARLGYGGASDDGTGGTSHIPASDGGMSAGVGASWRVDAFDLTPTSKLYLGLGLDFTVLAAKGDGSSSYFRDGWAEYVATVPLVAGARLRWGALVVAPELRYAPFGFASTDLEPASSGGLDQEDMPTALTLMVSIRRP